MSINVAENYLVIDGKRRFLYAGDCAYGRTAREFWRDRLLTMKAAGINTISFYCVWRFHETADNVWDFNGNHDIAAFLDLIHELGLYAIFRMGPFVHSEYRNGGYPDYLVEALGPRVRSNDDEYLHYSCRWYEKLLQIAKPRLIGAGGPIILIQLENELGSAGCKGDDIPRGSDDDEANRRHLDFYCTLVRSAGIELPLLDINKVPGRETLLGNHIDTGGHYPASCFCADGELSPFQIHPSNGTPWITIETGCGMFPRFFDYPPYRNTNSYQGPIIRAAAVEALAAQTIAEGASGIGFFVFCDGQHFGSDNESMIPFRDMNFQAPVSNVGTLRDSYRALKRLGWFVRAFEPELLKTVPDAAWSCVRSYGEPYPGAQSQPNDLFAGYGRECDASAETGGGRPVESLARVTPGLNLSDSNFLFLRNVGSDRAPWRRDIRIRVTPNKLACEVNKEYPARVQLELPPQTVKILPFFVKLAPHCFLDHSTATLLDRRPFADRMQVIAHATEEELVESTFAVPDAADCRTDEALLSLQDSPNQVTIIGKPSSKIAVAELSGRLRYVLIDSVRAGEAWELGELVAFSAMTVLESRAKNGIIHATVLHDAAFFELEVLSPSPLELSCPEADRLAVVDRGNGVWHLSGYFTPPPVQLRAAREYRAGDDWIIEGEVAPEDLNHLTELTVCCDYDGAGGQAYLDDELIGDHYFGRFLTWEIGLKHWVKRPGKLRICCRKARHVQWRLRAVHRHELTVTQKGVQ
ncbi:beta-galactosidase [Victivallis sp. Marseille-Q1083]|uniref:beta-galactosidase n=1 Tax=Victivallis sp. Marseille-Q1083 TaxID=2717288 RepID=UPI001588A901|nr:beta-galactosidase [Victivallis sp. Marseille-Q1083]